MTTSGTTSDNEWQRVTTDDNKWYSEWQRVTTSGTTSDNEWYNEWQRVVQRMKANESDFRFQNKTTMQCKTKVYSTTSFWKYNIKQNIYRSSHQRCSIKKLQFCNIHRKHLKVCNFIKKRLQLKCFPVNIAKFLWTPVLKNICERLLLHLLLIKTRDAFAAAKLFMK